LVLFGTGYMVTQLNRYEYAKPLIYSLHMSAYMHTYTYIYILGVSWLRRFIASFPRLR
jgi:hypothetical protein